jgi:hypothetical protein
LFNIDYTLLVIVAERFNIAITGTTEVKAWGSAGFGTARRIVVRYFTFLAQFLFIDAFHFCNS